MRVIDEVYLRSDLVGTTFPFQGQALVRSEEVVGCEGEGRECDALEHQGRIRR